MKAILYVRVSTTDQAENGHSLEAQERRLRQYADLKGFDQVELVSDEGLSGKSTDRPGFQRVMQAVDKRKVDAVVVYSLSRFARNTIATLEAIELMSKRGVGFHSMTEQLDTTSAIGRFFTATLAALAQLEREQIGERTRSVLQHKKQNGERISRVLPFGYRLGSDSVHLIRDEGEQQTIRLIRKLRKSGYTYSEIAQALETRKVQNKSGKVRWSKSQVYRIYTRAA